MKRGTSFKAQYRQPPARAATPLPPAWEPLSPVLRPSEPAAARPAQPLPPPSPSLGSPIAALADAAVASCRTSPAYADLPRRASHAASTPSIALPPASARAPKHAFATGHTHSSHERPAKRARSEHHTSPPYGMPLSRPATSHIPGYNVEHMVDSGTRMYQDGRANASRQANGGGDKRLSDAELLLFFSNVSAHTAQTPPSATKRWRVSQPSPHELPPQQTPQTLASASPLAATAVAVTTRATSDQTQRQQAGPLDVEPPPELPPFPPNDLDAASTSQTRTPPEETIHLVPQAPMREVVLAEEPKPEKQQGGAKGRSRGTRNAPSNGKRKRSTPRPKNASSTATATATATAPDQLQSPQSLPAEQTATMSNVPHSTEQSIPATSQNRRHSFSTAQPHQLAVPSLSLRAQSVPLGVEPVISGPAPQAQHPSRKTVAEQPELICAKCKSFASEIKVGDGEQWIGCDGCKEWYHYACAGFNSEREVRDVNKFYCDPCRPKFGETTKVRKSVRVHTTVDYAGLNEGVLKTSDDNPEHHYIAAFKNGDLEFTPETFARMPPELITADFLQKCNGFKEPILVPGALNSRAPAPSQDTFEPVTNVEQLEAQSCEPFAQFDYEMTADVGQDKLDMVIPEGLTVRRVAELYGPSELVPVIDVKAQEGEGKKWTMSKWADYYEQQGEKPVRNVISLEVSRSRLGKLIRRPKAVRDMDLQDAVWREDDKNAPPPVQFYCLMSVADCFTDFHIDFGGSSVYYHIVKGKKVFFFIPPTKQNLKKYEDWCLSPDQGHEWLGKQVKECYRVDLYPGDTMLIPSGWIHAVWTPEDSLVIGGNFLTRIHYGMQIKVLQIEKNTKVALQFRYPFFQKIMWLTVIKYLEEDPLPDSVRLHLERGEQFKRLVPLYCEPDKFGHNSNLGPPNYNRRYYSKDELEGLTDLLAYILRTVQISLDKIDVPQRTRGAVARSIPKGHGDPLVLAKRFAMWIAWKRGNETIPSWAMPDANLPEVAEAGEKKLSAAQVKKMERDSLHEAFRATAERSSARIRDSDFLPQPVREPSPLNYNQSPPNGLEDVLQFDMTPASTGPLTGFLRPSANNPHITTPKTSQLGPKRVACDTCRKRRIRCKHKDELIDTSKPGMHTIDLSGSYGISVKRRLSDHSIVDGQAGAATGPVNGGPIMADVNGDPYALKSGRVKACADCRKSKRRCIHDEYGNVDIIKANEVPIPRGSASKRRRVSDENSNSTAKRRKHESSYEEDYMMGDVLTRHSLPNQFGVGSSLLQDIACSAQQALARDEEDLVPVDPALQAYANDAYSAMDTAPLYATNGESVMSSIEQHAEVEFAPHNGGLHEPSVEPLTLGPPPQNDTVHGHTNGYSAPEIHVKANGFVPQSSHNNAVRRPSSPVSPRQMSTISPGMHNFNTYMTSPTMSHKNNDYNFTTNSDFPPPPATPTAKPFCSTDPPNGSGQKPSHTPSRNRTSKTPKSTPSSRRKNHRDGIKLETGLGGANMGVSMNSSGIDMIDPSLDQASIELIKQLQQEDLGLRRRSR